jgi:hypothetical protein
MAKSNTQLRKFNWQVPTIATSLIEGQDAPVMYDAFRKDITERFSNNKYIAVLNLVPAKDGNPAYVIGSNVFTSAWLDSKARENGMRVATLADVSNPQIMAMIKDRFYTDTPAFVVQSAEDSRAQNKGLLKQVIGHAEQKTKTIKFPFMVTGFDVVPFPEDNQGYQLGIAPRPDFAVVHDDRLSGKNYGKKFNEVDEL